MTQETRRSTPVTRQAAAGLVVPSLGHVVDLAVPADPAQEEEAEEDPHQAQVAASHRPVVTQFCQLTQWRFEVRFLGAPTWGHGYALS